MNPDGDVFSLFGVGFCGDRLLELELVMTCSCSGGRVSRAGDWTLASRGSLWLEGAAVSEL